MRAFYILLAVIAVLEGCTAIYFAEPQPQSAGILNSFPKEFQGAFFIDEEGMDTLFIEDSKYIYPEVFEKYIPTDKLDSLINIKIVGDLLYDDSVPTTKGIKFTITSDTLHYRIRLNLFKSLSDSLVLKKHKGVLILSEKEENKNYWNVYIIEKLKNNNLKLSAIGNFKTEKTTHQKIKFDGNLEDFYSITDFQEIDTAKYLINPTDKEFKKLLKKGLFIEFAEYRKITNHP